MSNLSPARNWRWRRRLGTGVVWHDWQTWSEVAKARFCGLYMQRGSLYLVSQLLWPSFHALAQHWSKFKHIFYIILMSTKLRNFHNRYHCCFTYYLIMLIRKWNSLTSTCQIINIKQNLFGANNFWWYFAKMDAHPGDKGVCDLFYVVREDQEWTETDWAPGPRERALPQHYSAERYLHWSTIALWWGSHIYIDTRRWPCVFSMLGHRRSIETTQNFLVPHTCDVSFPPRALSAPPLPDDLLYYSSGWTWWRESLDSDHSREGPSWRNRQGLFEVMMVARDATINSLKAHKTKDRLPTPSSACSGWPRLCCRINAFGPSLCPSIICAWVLIGGAARCGFSDIDQLARWSVCSGEGGMWIMYYGCDTLSKNG